MTVVARKTHQLPVNRLRLTPMNNLSPTRNLTVRRRGHQSQVWTTVRIFKERTPNKNDREVIL